MPPDFPQPEGQTSPGVAVWSALAPALRCPVCGEPMRLEGRALVCVKGHSFDLARAGYVNLVTSQRGAAHRPGDAPEMLRARERFFESGAYRPLAEQVAATVARFLGGQEQSAAPGSVPPLVVDVGCGTGYYLAVVGEELARRGKRARLLGLDAASEAAKITARRLASLQLPGIEGSAAVADLWRGLPLRPHVADVLLDIFAPRDAAEFARVLAPDGLLVILVPLPEHLGELRALAPLLDIEEAKVDRVVERLAPTFVVRSQETITTTVMLGGPALRDLVAMTPSARHIDTAHLVGLAASGLTQITIACTILAMGRAEGDHSPDAAEGGTI